jgi:archaemetzincin
VKGALYIMPVGEVAPRLVEWLREELSGCLDMPVRVAAGIPVPESSFEPARRQYHSTKILLEILREAPDDALKVLGVFGKDLCIPILTFVFGEAQLGGTAAIVSLARLPPEYYGLPPDEDTFRERLRKESLHELGHAFGLVHCPSLSCVMHLSYGIFDVDSKGRDFCRRCRPAVAL